MEWDAGTPRSGVFDDIYYSQVDGLAESRQVFLTGSALPDRWTAHAAPVFTLCEAGFGTGLNFLATWQAWREAPAHRPRLHYVGIEKFPLAEDQLECAIGRWPELAPLARQLLSHYPGRLPGQHRLILDEGRVTLDLWWEDLGATLEDLRSHGRRWVDAWYLDGFAPARNPEMWSRESFGAMAALSRTGASVASFTVAGAVRRGLEEAGFRVEKVPGHGSKRENLRARLAEAGGQTAAAQSVTLTPWDLPATAPTPPARVLVIGAGLAGCHVAGALARRGVEVMLLEQADIAAAGSGNRQGVIYTRLSRRHSHLIDFGLQSFAFAVRHYRQLFADGALGTGPDGALCGTFQQSGDEAEQEALAEAVRDLPGLVQVLDRAQANNRLGIEQPHGGYWYPQSGWIHPAAACRALLSRSRVPHMTGCGPITLERTSGGWRAQGPAGVLAEGDSVVIACGTGSRQLGGLDWLPVQSIRGQTTDIASTAALGRLRAVLCHSGYIAPASNGEHCIGATFNLTGELADLRVDEHHHNLNALSRAVPEWAEDLRSLDAGKLGGRVGFRCASPDYLPLAGPVPALEVFMQKLAPLRKNARRVLPVHGEFLPGLHVSTGYGSRGLTYTPLAAEHLASQLCDEPPPLSRALLRSLAPARFLVRDLGRNRR